MEKKRNINLDIIRIIALLFVISVHFLLYTGYYEEPIVGVRMYILTTIKCLLMACVPLFLLLTGYLNNKKEISKKYYFGIISKITLYLIAALIQILVMKYYERLDIGFLEALKIIFNFETHYGWYVNMYFGMYLIIPFINIIWNNLKDKKQKQILIIVMLILTVLPDIYYGKINIFSNWWITLYPITYYFIGAYLCEFKIKISNKLNTILLSLSVISFGLINYIICYNRNFIKYSFSHYWGGPMVVIVSLLLFNLLLNLNTIKIKDKLRNVIIKLSSLTFGAYLICWCFDKLVYDFLISRVVIENRVYFYPLCVLVIFVCSYGLSFSITYINKLIEKLYIKRINNERV